MAVAYVSDELDVVCESSQWLNEDDGESSFKTDVAFSTVELSLCLGRSPVPPAVSILSRSSKMGNGAGAGAVLARATANGCTETRPSNGSKRSRIEFRQTLADGSPFDSKKSKSDGLSITVEQLRNGFR